MSEEPAISGSRKIRCRAQGEELARTGRSPEENAKRLLSGEAWS